MKDNRYNLKAFSEKQHTKGKWNSRNSYPPIPFLITLSNLLSLKRKYTFQLSKLNKGNLILDMGCGKGSYSTWYLQGNKNAKIVAMDWSINALKSARENSSIIPVAADAQFMPFKPQAFYGAISIDTLGHIEKPSRALDELLRVLKNDTQVFIHSECSDYQNRWPDRELIRRLKKDYIAEKDGHFFIKESRELYKLFNSRFIIEEFISPAGITGWLTGYPENYKPLFKLAKMPIAFLLTVIPSLIRSIPIFRQMLQLVNSLINKIEIYFNISGGGSVFVIMKKEN